MFSKLTAWFLGEVHTVETLMADFHTKIAALEAHASDALAHVTHLTSVSYKVEEAKQEAYAEYDKATAVAEKLKEIVS